MGSRVNSANTSGFAGVKPVRKFKANSPPFAFHTDAGGRGGPAGEHPGGVYSPVSKIKKMPGHGEYPSFRELDSVDPREFVTSHLPPSHALAVSPSVVPPDTHTRPRLGRRKAKTQVGAIEACGW